MTILTTNMKIEYVGDGVKVAYNYDFLILESADALVKVDDVITTAYSISGLGNPNGGTVTFDVAPGDTLDILIQRDIDFTQEIDYRAYDSFPAETHETALDRIVMMVQQLSNSMIDLLAGAFTKASDTPSDVSTVVPAPGAGKFWKWSADGKSVEAADITELGETLVATATDSEIIDGTETQVRLLSPSQAKLAVQTHETGPILDIADVQWVEVVSALPGTPDPSTLYLVKQ